MVTVLVQPLELLLGGLVLLGLQVSAAELKGEAALLRVEPRGLLAGGKGFGIIDLKGAVADYRVRVVWIGGEPVAFLDRCTARGGRSLHGLRGQRRGGLHRRTTRRRLGRLCFGRCGSRLCRR